MHRAKITAVLMAAMVCGVAAIGSNTAFGQALPDTFSGERALHQAEQAVAFGPRPSASRANYHLQSYILEELEATCGCQVIEDVFIAATPQGDKEMLNIIARFPGDAENDEKDGPALAITGHYDTKFYPDRNFVGANDGASSTGFLLELARVLEHYPHTDEIYVVFFDGEEAVREEWAGEDNLYGSRHLAERWKQEGVLPRLKALINVDMIGDADLKIRRDGFSNRRVADVVWKTASDLGYGNVFVEEQFSVEDDHMPFLALDVPAIDIIDMEYRDWHEDSDTLDKLSAESLQMVGDVVLQSIGKLEAQ